MKMGCCQLFPGSQRNWGRTRGSQAHSAGGNKIPVAELLFVVSSSRVTLLLWFRQGRLLPVTFEPSALHAQ